MNGILLINKPKGYTSRDVVNIVSKVLKTKKVGHTGTLDPMATGVLVICIGKYTKLVDLITAYNKEYLAEILIGIKTDTLDTDGTILEKKENIELQKPELEKVIKSFQKTYIQEVPIYSAVKVNGRKLYDYARNNIEVELPKKIVTISDINMLDVELNDKFPKFSIKCSVSKGTYIRSLIKDICDELNVIGTMSNLCRTKQGNFNIEDCYSIEDLNNGEYSFLNIEDILDIEKVVLEDKIHKIVVNGGLIDNIYKKEFVMFQVNNSPIALYKKHDKDETKLKPFIMFDVK